MKKNKANFVLKHGSPFSNELDLIKEITQIKNLNKKLVSENCDLQDQLDIWASKIKIDNIF